MDMETLYHNLPTVGTLDQLLWGLPRLGPNADGRPHEWELALLLQAARLLECRTILEFGTFDGRTANLLAELPEVERVWTLDLPAEATPSLPMLAEDWRWIGREKVAAHPKVSQLWGDSALFDFGPYQGKCGLIFVMGAHSTEYIRNDILQARRLRAPEGHILLHAGTETALREARDGEPWRPLGGRMALLDWEET